MLCFIHKGGVKYNNYKRKRVKSNRSTIYQRLLLMHKLPNHFILFIFYPFTYERLDAGHYVLSLTVKHVKSKQSWTKSVLAF
ncbi:hypothetical protein HanRHA438_Chr07g0304071 [Helianthus annuus]|nr:hypothetical protein HanRHA438_Chr07g0304071 [Helianthus annuus]